MKPEAQLIPTGASAKKLRRVSIARISHKTLSTRPLLSRTGVSLSGSIAPS
jgi:hypothetical protein